MATYKYRGLEIDKDTYDKIRTIGVLNNAGQLTRNSANNNITQALLNRPKTSGFQQNLNAYLTGGQQAKQPSQQAPAQRAFNPYLDDVTQIPGYKAPRTRPQTPPTSNIAAAGGGQSQAPQQSMQQGRIGLGSQPGELFGKGGLLGEDGIAAGITKPFRSAIGNKVSQLGLVKDIAGDVLSGKSLDQAYRKQGITERHGEGFDFGRLQSQINQAAMNQPNFLITDQEEQDYFSNPLVGDIKNNIGMASFVVPVGTAATTAGRFGQAATAGGLQGIGSSRSGEEGQGLVQGALGGAGGYGIVAGAGKILSGARNVGGNLKGNVLSVDANKLKNSKYAGVTGAKQLEDDALGVIRELGGKPSTKQQAAEAIDQGISGLQSQVGQQTANANSLFNVNKIDKQFKTLFKNNPKVAQNADVQEMILNLRDKGANVNAQSLSDTYFELQNLINFNRNNLGSAPEAERALRGLHDIIGKELKTNVPNLSGTLDKLSILHEAQPFATRTATRGASVGLPFNAIPGVRVNAAPLTDRLQTGVGRALTSVQGVDLRSIINPLAARTGAGMATNPPQFEGSGSNITQQPISGFTTTPRVNRDDGQATNNDMLRQIILGGVTAGDISPAEGKAYLDLYSQGGAGGGQRIPAGQAAELGDVASSLNQLGLLQEQFNNNTNVFDPVTGSIRLLNPYDSNVQSVNAIIRSVKQVIGKGLEGGVLRAEDEKKYEQILPKITDTPETVQSKIDQLGVLLRSKYNDRIGSFEQAGYDVSNFGYAE